MGTIFLLLEIFSDLCPHVRLAPIWSSELGGLENFDGRRVYCLDQSKSRTY